MLSPVAKRNFYVQIWKVWHTSFSQAAPETSALQGRYSGQVLEAVFRLNHHNLTFFNPLVPEKFFFEFFHQNWRVCRF